MKFLHTAVAALVMVSSTSNNVVVGSGSFRKEEVNDDDDGSSISSVILERLAELEGKLERMEASSSFLEGKLERLEALVAQRKMEEEGNRRQRVPKELRDQVKQERMDALSHEGRMMTKTKEDGGGNGQDRRKLPTDGQLSVGAWCLHSNFFHSVNLPTGGPRLLPDDSNSNLMFTEYEGYYESLSCRNCRFSMAVAHNGGYWDDFDAGYYFQDGTYYPNIDFWSHCGDQGGTGERRDN